MIENPSLESRLRKLMDEAAEILPKLSGAHLELSRQYHLFLADAAGRELERRKTI